MEKINISNICVILNNYFIHYCDSNVWLFFIAIERATTNAIAIVGGAMTIDRKEAKYWHQKWRIEFLGWSL